MIGPGTRTGGGASGVHCFGGARRFAGSREIAAPGVACVADGASAMISAEVGAGGGAGGVHCFGGARRFAGSREIAAPGVARATDGASGTVGFTTGTGVAG